MGALLGQGFYWDTLYHNFLISPFVAKTRADLRAQILPLGGA